MPTEFGYRSPTLREDNRPRRYRNDPFEVGRINLANDSLRVAEGLYRKSYEMRYKLDGEKAGTSEETKALYKLGRKAWKLGSSVDAERLYNDCLAAIRRVHVIVAHVDVAIVLLRLSEVLFDIGRICEAKKLFGESMENVIKVHGRKFFSPITDSCYMWSLMFGRADVLRFALDKEQGFYRDCVELHSKLFPTGFDHIGLASILHELGHVSDGDSDKWFEESISMQRRLLDKGKPHSSLALTLFSWAYVEKKRGRLDDALKLYQRSLKMERKLRGSNVDHNDVAITLYELAEVRREKGDISEAERLHRMSFEMRFRLHGSYSGSRQKARTLYKLGFRALEKELFAAAKRLFAECLDFVRRLHGGIKYHVDIAITLQGSAGALLGSNEKNKAESVFHDCLDMWDDLLPKEISGRVHRRGGTI